MRRLDVRLQYGDTVEARRDLPDRWPDPPVPRGSQGRIIRRLESTLGRPDQFVVDFAGRPMTVGEWDLKRTNRVGLESRDLQRVIRIAGALLGAFAVIILARMLVGAVQHALTMLAILFLARMVFKAFR